MIEKNYFNLNILSLRTNVASLPEKYPYRNPRPRAVGQHYPVCVTVGCIVTVLTILS